MPMSLASRMSDYAFSPQQLQGRTSSLQLVPPTAHTVEMTDQSSGARINNVETSEINAGGVLQTHSGILQRLGEMSNQLNEMTHRQNEMNHQLDQLIRQILDDSSSSSSDGPGLWEMRMVPNVPRSHERSPRAVVSDYAFGLTDQPEVSEPVGWHSASLGVYPSITTVYEDAVEPDTSSYVSSAHNAIREGLPSETNDDGNLCIICRGQNAQAEYAFFRCGHLCACRNCVTRIMGAGGTSQCPVCRQRSASAIRIFRV